MVWDGAGSWGARWTGIVSLGVRRTLTRFSGGESRQVWLTILGIAIPIALLLLVTSVSIGLGAETTVRSPDVDYWIVPDTGGASSAVVSVGGPRFGSAHVVSAEMNGRDGISYATPVLIELLKVQSAQSREFVLVIGVIPGAEADTFAGVSTQGMTPGDPYYGNGTYTGAWTGEVVVSGGASELLRVAEGDMLSPASGANESFTVVGVSDSGEAITGQFPVAVVQLSELQAVSGVTDGDLADQFLIQTTSPSVRDYLGSVYPRSQVISRSGLSGGSLFSSSLPLSLSLAGFVVAVFIGVLFATSTLGLVVAGDAKQRALLAAIGVSRRSRAVLIASHALILAFIGGLIGVILGVLGIEATNRIVARVFLELPVAQFHPLLIPYGLGVAVVIGVLTVPYLWVMGRRTTTIRDLTE